jgi:hypothetical protein
MITIELGNSDHTITDVLFPDGSAGIAFTIQDCEIGKEFNSDAKTDIDMHSYFRIVSSESASLDVIIAACERAKERMNGGAALSKEAE